MDEDGDARGVFSWAWGRGKPRTPNSLQSCPGKEGEGPCSFAFLRRSRIPGSGLKLTAAWHPLSQAGSLSALLGQSLCHFLLGSRCLLTQGPPVGRSPAIPARAQCQLPHRVPHLRPSTPSVPVLAAGSLDDAKRRTPSPRTYSQMRASGLTAATVLGMGVLRGGKSSESLHRRSLEPQGVQRQFSGRLLCLLLPWPHFALSLWDSLNLSLPPEESSLTPIKSLQPNSLRGTYWCQELHSLSAWV